MWEGWGGFVVVPGGERLGFQVQPPERVTQVREMCGKMPGMGIAYTQGPGTGEVKKHQRNCVFLENSMLGQEAML